MHEMNYTFYVRCCLTNGGVVQKVHVVFLSIGRVGAWDRVEDDVRLVVVNWIYT